MVDAVLIRPGGWSVPAARRRSGVILRTMFEKKYPLAVLP